MALSNEQETAQAHVRPGEVKAVDIAAMNLWQKLAAITGEVGSIAKGGKNREQGYAFIEYGAVAGALRTLFGKYHVMCIPTMGERHEDVITTQKGAKGYHVLIEFTFTFINGDKPEEKQEIRWTGEATDYGDKATNKAATSALKYCLMRTFNVSEQGEEDPDVTTPPPANDIQRTERPGANGYATEAQRREIRRVLALRGFDTPEMQKAKLEEMGETTPLTVGAASRVLDQLKGRLMSADEKAEGIEAIQKRIADIDERIEMLSSEKALLEETIARVEAEA